MHKLYNFEAIFKFFIKSKNLPSKVQKDYLVFFRSYINWLALHLQIQLTDSSLSAFLSLFGKDYIAKYKSFLKSSDTSASSIKLRTDILEAFQIFLTNNQSLPTSSTTDTNLIMKLALVDEFVKDLEEHGRGETTLRGYKSDVLQFLNYLDHGN